MLTPRRCTVRVCVCVLLHAWGVLPFLTPVFCLKHLVWHGVVFIPRRHDSSGFESQKSLRCKARRLPAAWLPSVLLACRLLFSLPPSLPLLGSPSSPPLLLLPLSLLSPFSPSPSLLPSPRPRSPAVLLRGMAPGDVGQSTLTGQPHLRATRLALARRWLHRVGSVRSEHLSLWGTCSATAPHGAKGRPEVCQEASSGHRSRFTRACFSCAVGVGQLCSPWSPFSATPARACGAPPWSDSRSFCESDS